ANLVKAMYRLCPSSKAAIENYIGEHRYRLISVDKFIKSASEKCEDPALVREILSDFIDKSGKAFLIVSR
ncbi:hypothetical protein PFISCL1PPCAC_21170, partial [Pristionchus fissidentatus]